MRNQKKALMSAEGAIKRLAKLMMWIDDKVLAEWIIEGDKLGECDADDLHGVVDFLMDTLHSGVLEFKRAKPHQVSVCTVCGNDGSRRMESRSHARYCSDKCRQKAYRQRNGSSDRSHRQSVTNGTAVTIHSIDQEAKT
jgi:hypothetical protein